MTNLHLARVLVAAHRTELEADARASRRWTSRRRTTTTYPASAPLAAATERTTSAAAERVAA